ncbi:hypothetical protein ACLOJK_018059 [Asimina triloba]
MATDGGLSFPLSPSLFSPTPCFRPSSPAIATRRRYNVEAPSFGRCVITWERSGSFLPSLSSGLFVVSLRLNRGKMGRCRSLRRDVVRKGSARGEMVAGRYGVGCNWPGLLQCYCIMG